MSKPLVVLFFLILMCLQFGCGNQTARNRNAQIVGNYNRAVNGNSDDTDINSNSNGNAVDGSLRKFTDAQSAVKKGDELLDANEIEKAIIVFKQAIELDSNLALAHLQLGVAYDLKEKADRLKPIIGDVSDSPEKNSIKSLKNAVNVYKTMIEKNPEDDSAFFNLGRAYTKLFNDRQSEIAFRKAAKLKPDDGDYQTEYGAALIKLARYSSAKRALNKALEIDENNFRAEDLLKQATAGQRRVGFKPKPKETPKSPSTDHSEGQAQPASAEKPKSR